MAGRSEKVVSFADDLSFGPINPADPVIRVAWARDHLAWTDRNYIVEASREFWPQVLAPGPSKTLWTSRRSVMEFTGFLECVRRLGENSFDVIDLADCTTVDPFIHAPTLSALNARIICSERLFDRHKPLDKAVLEGHSEVWSDLRKENAPLRTLVGGKLKSVPISFFDEELLAHANSEWQSSMKVVGQVLAAEDEWAWDRCSDIVLRSRIEALIQKGILESRDLTASGMPRLIRLAQNT